MSMRIIKWSCGSRGVTWVAALLVMLTIITVGLIDGDAPSWMVMTVGGPTLIAGAAWIAAMATVSESPEPRKNPKHRRRRVEMIWVDPSEIVLSDSLWAINRDGVDELAASIKSVGLLQPPTAYRNDIGEVVVLIGRRRVMASIIAGLPLIPVVMLPPQSGAACLAVQVIDDTSRAVKPREQVAGGVSAMMALGFSRVEILGVLGCPDPKEPGRLIRKGRSMASA